jgi:hypothetical protein
MLPLDPLLQQELSNSRFFWSSEIEVKRDSDIFQFDISLLSILTHLAKGSVCWFDSLLSLSLMLSPLTFTTTTTNKTVIS